MAHVEALCRLPYSVLSLWLEDGFGPDQCKPSRIVRRGLQAMALLRSMESGLQKSVSTKLAELALGLLCFRAQLFSSNLTILVLTCSALTYRLPKRRQQLQQTTEQKQLPCCR
ncbi:unnamed protein product [Polarella glacialis]|uniref:Uncharacterized protein n=1 Tax=Polarella glacialis TaxID=89957 RepID=A0A813H0B7_POLGL|nr:unnamed protein product [Polarella glacialis]